MKPLPPFEVPNFFPALPEIFLLAAVSLILIVDVFLDDTQRYVSFALSLLALAVCAWLTISTSTFTKSLAFNGMFVDDALSDVLKVCVYIAVATVMR